MALFRDPEAVVLKEGTGARDQLAALEALRGSLPPAAEQQLEFDIRAVKAGIAGEDRILYELKNAHMDLFVLQDLYLEHNGLTAQIDFLVLTRQRNFVLECKNLYGNIEVNNRGDFIRSFGGRKREGIYSPLTQNERHLELIHAMRRADRNFAQNLLFDREFDDVYCSLVVLANPKTVLNDRFAKKEVKQKIVRADQLVAAMRKINDERGPGNEKVYLPAVRRSAEWFLAQCKPNPVDYAARYRKLAEEAADAGRAQHPEEGKGAQTVRCPICGAPMVLRTARRGARAGKRFYGCSNYPTCHGLVNVD